MTEAQHRIVDAIMASLFVLFVALLACDVVEAHEAVLVDRCEQTPAGCMGVDKLPAARIWPTVPCAIDMPLKRRWVEAWIAGRRACATYVNGRVLLADPDGAAVWPIRVRADQAECIRIECRPDMHHTTGAMRGVE